MSKQELKKIGPLPVMIPRRRSKSISTPTSRVMYNQKTKLISQMLGSTKNQNNNNNNNNSNDNNSANITSPSMVSTKKSSRNSHINLNIFKSTKKANKTKKRKREFIGKHNRRLSIEYTLKNNDDKKERNNNNNNSNNNSNNNDNNIRSLSSPSPSPSNTDDSSISSSKDSINLYHKYGNKTLAKQLKKYKIKEPITLNIGGMKFDTTLTTLLKYDDSIFAHMFSGKYLIKPSKKDKSFFIDRDGTHFRLILNYLRTGKLIIEYDNELLKKELLNEALFYQINPLITMLKPKCGYNVDSKILNEFYIKCCENWILNNNTNNNNRNINNNIKWKLLYRATRDGFKSSEFHRRCDHKGPTIVIINANDSIFGGYTTIAWNHDGKSVDQIKINKKSSTFTFFLECNSQIWKKKYSLIKPEKWVYYGKNNIHNNNNRHLNYNQKPCYSVYHHSNFGPVFGYRPKFDYGDETPAHLVIGNDSHKFASSKLDSFVGESLGVRKHMSDSFYVFDYEVFQIIQT